MQKELDAIIQLGVANITGLLKNSETKVTSATVDEDDEFEMKNRIHRSRDMSEQLDTDNDIPITKRLNTKKSLTERFKEASRDNLKSSDSGQLSERLVKQGLLTKSMLIKLQQEWLAARGDLSSSNKKPGRK